LERQGVEENRDQAAIANLDEDPLPGGEVEANFFCEAPAQNRVVRAGIHVELAMPSLTDADSDADYRRRVTRDCFVAEDRRLRGHGG
jgi:hypothetical protein